MLKVTATAALSPAKARLVRALRSAAGSDLWELVPGTGGTIVARYTETGVTTPDAFRSIYDHPTYDRHMWVTVLPHEGRAWSVVLDNARAPWLSTSQSKITMARACALLSEPAAIWA